MVTVAIRLVFWSLSLSKEISCTTAYIYSQKIINAPLLHQSLGPHVFLSLFLLFFFFFSLSLPPSSSLFHFLIVDSRLSGPGPLKDPDSYLFILLLISFALQKILSLTESQLFIFDFVSFPIGIRYKKLLPRSMLGAYHLWFLLGILWFQVLHFSFDPLRLHFCV